MQPHHKNTLKEVVIIIISLLLSVSILMIMLNSFSSGVKNFLGIKVTNLSQNMSIGDKLLITENATPNKIAGIKYFQQKKYQKAQEEFTKSLAQNPNDPETVTYLENTVAIQDKNYFKIALVVPIGSNLNVAQEMLRGQASAQKEINLKGGINGHKLLMQIIDDKNDPEIAKQVATELIEDPEILAVIGSNASTPSLAAAPIYKQAGLVMITPTSFADEISGLAWRLYPSAKISAAVLADYIVNTAQKTKIAICYDSSAIDTISFKDELIASLLTNKATIIPLVCDLNKTSFNPLTMMNEIIKQGADSLFAASHVDHVESMILLAQINQGKLPLFSSGVMYNIKTLTAGKSLQGLTLTTIYHPDLNPSFAMQMDTQWKGRVSWRTAISFDATNVIITALKQAQTREGIEQILRNPQFMIQGATGIIKFDPNTGDRISKPLVVQVQQTSSNKYDFVIQR